MTDQLPAIIQPFTTLTTPADTYIVPALIADAGDAAGWRYVEFLTANINNPNTRRAYARACARFFAWCEQRGLTLAAIRPFYETATSRPVAVLLRPGKTPSGDEVRRHLRRLVRRIRSHWPSTRLTIRGDGHYGRPEVMAWCEINDVDYVLGLPGNATLSRLVEVTADDVRVRRAEAQAPAIRRYNTLYCARGQAENLIKLHRSQLASDRTSCRSALANQVRLVLHTAAYWLMLTMRDAIAKLHPLATAEFTTLRMRLLKVAARITQSRQHPTPINPQTEIAMKQTTRRAASAPQTAIPASTR